MIRYYVYNLEIGKNFTVDTVSFERISTYIRNVRIIKNKHKDQLTFYAKEEASKPSRFFSGNSATSVNDMMILLSLAQSRNIFYAKAKDTKTRNEWGMPLGGKRQPSGFTVIMEHEIESFLNTSLRQILEPSWLDKTGFNPAVFWWLESIYANRPLETKFVSSFVALEVLANAYCSEQGFLTSLPKDKFNELVKPVVTKALLQIDSEELPHGWIEPYLHKVPELNRLSISNKINKLADAYKWNFMEGDMIRDWVDLRNKYMHEGSTRSLETMNKAMIGTRYFQLINSVQIALIDLLGFHDFARKQYLIDEIKKPIRKIIRDAGPFKVTT